MRGIVLLVVLAASAAGCSAPSSAPEAGTVLPDFGSVYPVPDAAGGGDPSEGIQAVFDIATGADAPELLNPRIESVARYLNLHVGAGFPRERVRAALVLHGTAARDALNHRAYRKRYGTDNPSLELLGDLRTAGVEIYLCGQTAGRLEYKREEVAEPVKVALSAMTVLAAKQADGYALIPF